MNAFVLTIQKWEKDLELGNQAHMPFIEEQDNSKDAIELISGSAKPHRWTFEWSRQQKAHPAASCDCAQS